MNGEDFYVLYRRLKAFGKTICFHLCRIFPIDQQLISVCTFEGKGGFGCNPKYIVQALHEKRPDLKFVWLVNKIGEHNFPDYIKEVSNSFWSSAYWLTRSKVWIDNYRKPLGTVKRKGQYYLNTWHGSVGFKPIGLWRGEKFSKIAYLVSKNDSDMIDCLIVNSDWSAKMMVKGMVYDGTILKLGQAREDVMLYDSTEIRTSVRKKYNLPENARIVLYAPTYRESNMQTTRKVFSEQTSIDIGLLKKSLQERFGGDWYVLAKLHPQLAESHSIKDTNVIDVSREDDTNRLIAAADVVVTDFSNVAFEAGAYGIPVFQYIDDLSDYISSRGNLFFNINDDGSVVNNEDLVEGFNVKTPFIVMKSNDEMVDKIKSFNEKDYLMTANEMTEKMGWVKDGQASYNAASVIIKFLSANQINHKI